LTCQNLNRPEVLEGYLDNIQYCESLTLYEEYQRKLLTATMELREAVEKEHVEVNSTASGEAVANAADSGSADKNAKKGSESALSRLNEVAKRQELESLATTLKTQLPSARMCPQCHYGPMLHQACFDLRSHQDQVVREVKNDDGTQVRVQIDNSCPQCKWLGRSWAEWIPWDGSLPTTLRGDAFKLAGGDAAVKVLTPAEVREQRLLALQRTSDASSFLKKGAMYSSKPVSATPKTKQELEEEARKAAYKKLQADRLRVKVEKERILRQFHAEHENLKKRKVVDAPILGTQDLDGKRTKQTSDDDLPQSDEAFWAIEAAKEHGKRILSYFNISLNISFVMIT